MIMIDPIPVVTVVLLLAAASIAEGTSSADGAAFSDLKTDYINLGEPPRIDVSNLRRSGESSSSYVFLQKFPLQDTDGFLFHTEVLVCPKENFSPSDQKTLDDKAASLTDYIEIEESWWSTRTANCVEMGYGGAPCSERCCAVPHGTDQVNFPLNERRAVISNADTTIKSLYLYGTGKLDGDAAYHALCDKKCWSNWAGTDYNPLTNNCNTFTSTVLACVFNLSEKKPNLGPSDMVTVTCDKCPSSSQVVAEIL